jgi:succinyl-diaminopimelate desuccinylase
VSTSNTEPAIDIEAAAEPREVVTVLERHWQARMVQAFLEANGISAWLNTRGAEAVADPALVIGGHEVAVRRSDVDIARELVASGSAGVEAEAPADEGAERVEARLMELLAFECVTGGEEPIADWLADRCLKRGEEVARVGNSLVVGHVDDARPTVLLVGHLDVVPATEADRSPRLGPERVVGRGASDMKSGLAVALDCFEDTDLRAGPYNLLLVAYAGEEGPAETNELPALLEGVPELGTADLAVVLEPTDLTVQLGCLGGLHAEVTVSGSAAHSARPWYGENALTKAGSLLSWLHQRQPAPVRVGGLAYHEVITATQAWTANARNVVPGAFTLNVNYRFAPHRTLQEAEKRLRHLLGSDGDVEIVDRALPAPPGHDDELVNAFVTSVGAAVEGKQAWTDVARLVDAGVPALNYGPGLAAQAHVAGEYVPRANLTTARVALARFLAIHPAELTGEAVFEADSASSGLDRG